MHLFDDVPRIKQGPAAHYEGTFNFLTTSAQPYAANVRALLESWFSHYPASHLTDLRRQFRDDFDAAFFEFLLFELLARLDHQVTVHPGIPGSRSHPDFFAKSPEGKSCFLEARVASDKTAAEAAKDRALSVLYDEINRRPLPNYFLHLHRIDFPPGQPPSGRRFRSFVDEKASQIDYSGARAALEASKYSALPTFEYHENNAVIEFTLLPAQQDNRGREGNRAIGAYPIKTRWGSSTTAIRKALQRKAGKYGWLSEPFLIAVNSISDWGTRKTNALEALFGSEHVVIEPLSASGRLGRNADGFWSGPAGPQNRRTSAVLIGSINPFNLHVADLTLWLNPWAANPYEGPLMHLSYADVQSNHIVFKDGISIGQLLGIPADWPGDRDED